MSVNEKLEKIIQGRREQYRHWKFCLTSFSNLLNGNKTQRCIINIVTPKKENLKMGF